MYRKLMQSCFAVKEPLHDALSASITSSDSRFGCLVTTVITYDNNPFDKPPIAHLDSANASILPLEAYVSSFN